MIVTLIGVGLICIGFILGRIQTGKTWHVANRIEDFRIVSHVLGGFVTAVSVCVILLNIAFLRYEYESKLHEREMLEYRIEHLSEDTVGNEMLYNDIVEFNNSLRWAKRTANSPWISWFSNHKVAGLDYVGLD